ncbi:unnamed protein product, partial [Musa acuminata subsp. burmannicoides]
ETLYPLKWKNYPTRETRRNCWGLVVQQAIQHERHGEREASNRKVIIIDIYALYVRGRPLVP